MLQQLLRLNRGLSVALGLLAAAGLRAAAAPEAADLIVTNGYVLTMNPQKQIIESGTVVIRDAHIIAVGPAAMAANYTAKRTLDAGGAIVMPGMINTHTHAAMTVFRGLGDDEPDRLKRFIFPLEKKFVDREVVYWGSLHGMVEMIEGGVTTLVDMYYFEDEVARAAKKTGMRGILGETVVNFAAPDAPEPYGGIAYTKTFAEKYRDDPLITPAFAPHAPYTVDEEHLRIIGKESAALNLPVLMHVSEMPSEMETFRKERNQTPIEYLDTIGLLNRRLVAAHCIFATESDIALLKARDVGVAHNMVANIKSGKGVAPIPAMRAAGVRVGLGTDGPMSGNTLDVLGQFGYVAKLQKLEHHTPTIMPAVDVVEMATMGGARALHLEDKLGSLEAGKLADLILIDRESTPMVPFYDVYAALAFAASARDVRTSIIHGRIVMENRKVLTVDTAEVKDHMRALAAKIVASSPGK